MSDQEILQLASEWIRRYELVRRLGDKAPEAEKTYCAYLVLDHLARTHPEDAWQVILKIIELSDDDFVLENVAAGPLESLIASHGRSLIDRIESRATADPKFVWVLRGVWQGKIDDYLWARLMAVAGESD